ncbi:serine/threonine-protein kinase [Tuwongella immobilis]|nr:serine/threonine-protein kinase [Tuwongella immobilis]
MEDTTNSLVLELLAASNSCGAAGAEFLRQSWQTQAMTGESFPAFLVRQQLFHAHASRLLELTSRGRITLGDAEPLLGSQRWAILQSLSQRPARWTSPPTISTLAGKSSLQHTSQVSVELFGSNTTTDRTAVPMPQIGSQLGKCLLISLLGRGAAGTVYRALHQGLNISVAVKVLNENIVQNRKAYEQLRSEARVLAQLNHPNILRVLDFEDDARAPYVVMECVEGLSLADLLQQAGPLEYPRALTIITQIADALQAVWGLGIIHRDVKPANILLTKDGVAKLADLGLAMVVDHSQASLHGVAGRAGGIVGTAAYMAPEQFTNPGNVDPRADIYSLGITFYQLVTGRLPFQATTLAAMLVSHASETPEPPHLHCADLPLAASQVILKMLAKKPEERFDSYASLLTALRGLVPGFRRPMDAMGGSATPTLPQSPQTVQSESMVIRSQLVRRLLGNRTGDNP